MANIRENAQEEERDENHPRASNLSTNFFFRLKLRELSNKGNLRLNRPGNIYRDYYLHQYSLCNFRIQHIVMADDVICVIYGKTGLIYGPTGLISSLVPFTRFRRDRNGELAACTTQDNDSTNICHTLNGFCEFVCYNSNNNSLIMLLGWYPTDFRIMSSQLEFIKSREAITTHMTQVLPNEVFDSWDFDILNCRGMIYNHRRQTFKIFELKHYTLLSAISVECSISRFHMRFQIPANTEMVGFKVPYFPFRVPYTTPSKLREIWRSNEINSFNIYSTSNGDLLNQIVLPDSKSITWFDFVILCGSDTIVMQQREHNLQILDIGYDIPRVVGKPRIRALGYPYFLNKRRHFICQTDKFRLEVFNLRGGHLFTLRDSPQENPPCYYRYKFFITKEQDTCTCHSPSFPGFEGCISIHDIRTGETMAEFTQQKSLTAFAYDEKTYEIFQGNQNGTLSVMSNRFYNDVSFRQIFLMKNEDSPTS